MASPAALQRMERLRAAIAQMEDELLTDEERVGLDYIRNNEDLELAIKFQLEVYGDPPLIPVSENIKFAVL